MPPITINQPSDLVRHYRHRAKRSFGQHFLSDASILGDLVDAAGVEAGDPVLEIGPGCGTLTWTLLQRGCEVTAVELERDAARFLREIELEGDLELVEDDILDVDLDELLDGRNGSWYCVSNLPFGAATEIYFHLAGAFDRFERLVLMFQREVADRMVAVAGEEAFGALSLTAQLYGELTPVRDVPPGAFRPPPEVHGTVVKVDPIEGTRIPDREVRRRFKAIVRAAFQRRRKILPNAVSSLPVDKERFEAAMETVGLDRTIRPERVTFSAWWELADSLEGVI